MEQKDSEALDKNSKGKTKNGKGEGKNTPESGEEPQKKDREEGERAAYYELFSGMPDSGFLGSEEGRINPAKLSAIGGNLPEKRLKGAKDGWPGKYIRMKMPGGAAAVADVPPEFNLIMGICI